MSYLRKVIDGLGGVKCAAEICRVSPRAVYKWLEADALPRTDYTGETCYADLLAGASDGLFPASELLKKAKPNRAKEAA